MGQLAESMGLQTQVGVVKFDQLHRLELPVMVQRKHHYALITEVGRGESLSGSRAWLGSLSIPKLWKVGVNRYSSTAQTPHT